MGGILTRRRLIAAKPHIETASGAVASWENGVALPIKSCIVSIAPVQDLHGYQNPWPAGGGKNKADYPALITAGAVEQDDGSLYVATASSFSNIKAWENDGTTGQFAVTFIIKNDGTSRGIYPVIKYTDSTEEPLPINTGTTTYTTYTKISNNSKTVDCVYFKYGSSTVKNWFYIQVESGSTATAWTPYSNICSISGWTEANVYRTGTNVFDYDATKATTGTTTAGTTRAYYPIGLSNCTLSFSAELIDSGSVTSTNINIGKLVDGKLTVVNGLISPTGITQRTITFAANEEAVFMTADTSASSITLNFPKYNIMVNLGSTATAYEPYSGTSLTIPFTVGGDTKTIYGGTVSVDADGKVKLTATMAEVDLGTLSWESNAHASLGTYFYASISSLRVKRAGSFTVNWDNCLCERYAQSGRTAESFLDGCFTFDGNANAVTQLQIKDASCQDATAFALAVNGTKLVYDLAEPVEYDLSDVTVLSTLVGTNVMWADTGDTAVQYWAHP